VSLGDMQEQIQTGGTTAVITPVGTFATPGGFLVRSSNAGRGFQDEFAVIPEVGLKVGYQLNERLSVEAGYTWLYVSNVLRPGDQVGAVSPTGQPFIPFKETDFFAHGMSFGVAYRY